MPPPDRSGQTSRTGGKGEEEEGGSGGSTGGKSGGSGGKSGGTGGKSATGGAGGTTEKPDAAVEVPVDAAIPVDTARKLDAARDFAANPNATFEKLELVLANCVYCHNDASKRADFQYTNLHGKLVNAVAEKSPAACPTRMLVVPGEPMQSLLYLKVAGTMASTCGARMPFNKPMVTPMELKIVYDWIMAGAPEK
jgi:hypothetical protein